MEHEAKVTIMMRSIDEWPEDHLRRAWRLVSSTVRRLTALAPDDADRIAYLADAEDDAALFGNELIRRGLL